MKCRFCNSSNIINLFRHSNYPIFIGCTDEPQSADEIYEFEIYYCRNCNIIQQINLPSVDILYRERRAFGIGKVWKKHYEEYFNFIIKGIENKKNILEIGGGNGVLIEKLYDYDNSLFLHDIEPDPFYNLPFVTVYKDYLSNGFELNKKFDIIYCSHLIEHHDDVNYLLEKCHDMLTEDGYLFTACPNVLESFREMHLNAFTTDHFNYFTPNSLQGLTSKHAFAVDEFFQYNDHGMYFRFKKTENIKEGFRSEDLYGAFQKYENRIKEFTKYIRENIYDGYYLFGAHAFTITFLRYLQVEENAIAILDNEPTKQGRRLSGTSLICRDPNILAKEKSPTVILYMGAYTKEISTQLMTINSNTRIIRLDKFQEGTR